MQCHESESVILTEAIQRAWKEISKVICRWKQIYQSLSCVCDCDYLILILMYNSKILVFEFRKISTTYINTRTIFVLITFRVNFSNKQLWTVVFLKHPSHLVDILSTNLNKANHSPCWRRLLASWLSFRLISKLSRWQRTRLQRDIRFTRWFSTN